MNNGHSLTEMEKFAPIRDWLEERRQLKRVKPVDAFEEEKKLLGNLYNIFGRAVFVPAKIWGPPDEAGNFGAKGAPLCKYWPKLTHKNSLLSEHQEMLYERIKGDSNKLGWVGNIAVLLGEPSDNLVSIDLDDAAWIEPFLDANPALRETTQVPTYRGRQIFLRLTDDYPKTVCQLTVDGKAIGEFRGGRGLSTVFGFHPKGTRDTPVAYCPTSETVITYRYKDLVFPAGVTLDDSSRSAKRDRKSRKKYSLAGKPGSIDTESLREAIECDVEALCAELFPDGRMVGLEFRLADKEGHAPRVQGSLTVQTTGEYAGYWTDWATGDDGDLIDLVKSVYGVGFEAAIRKIEDILGESFRVPEDDTFTLKNNASVRLPSDVNTNGSELADLEINRASVGKRLADVLPLPPAKPKLVLPCSKYPISDSAKDAFSGMATTGEYFCYGGAFAEIFEGKVTALKPIEFASRLERVFSLVKLVITKEGVSESASRCSEANAKELLGTREMREHSLPLSRISKIPVLVSDGNTPKILTGPNHYHREHELLVLQDEPIPDMTIEEAKVLLTDQLFGDYDFVTPSDYSRAVALVLTPAMSIGGLLGGTDYPMDLGIANQSQSGKTHRAKIIAAIYGEIPHTISLKTRGVGGLDESIQAALVSGKRFILFDNVRGDFESQTLESIIRGSGEIEIRLPYRPIQVVSTSGYAFQLTSNQASLTPDLINRSLIVNNLKQPKDYRWKLLRGDDFIDHVRENQTPYLGAVYKILSEWISRGRPSTTENRHNFYKWAGAMDYIITEILGMPRLLDDYDPRGLVDPTVSWLRLVIHNLQGEQKFDTTDLWNFLERNELEVYSKKNTQVESAAGIGKLLTPIFPESGTEIKIEGWTIKREDGTHEEKKFYRFTPPKPVDK
jgi:hypothetical protein